MKKLLISACTAILATGLLAGCGSSEDDGMRIEVEPEPAGANVFPQEVTEVAVAAGESQKFLVTIPDDATEVLISATADPRDTGAYLRAYAIDAPDEAKDRQFDPVEDSIFVLRNILGNSDFVIEIVAPENNEVNARIAAIEKDPSSLSRRQIDSTRILA